MAGVMGDAEVADLRGRYGGALLRLALWLCDGDHGRAEDLVQETWVRAWRHPEALTGGQHPLPWLFTVTRRLAIDGHRRRQHRPEVSQETLDREPAVSDGTDRLLDAQSIAAAMARLSHPHRQVIIELYYRDLSVTEAAVVLGIPPGTVKSRTFYALKALRLALGEAAQQDVPAGDALRPALAWAVVPGRGSVALDFPSGPDHRGAVRARRRPRGGITPARADDAPGLPSACPLALPVTDGVSLVACSAMTPHCTRLRTIPPLRRRSVSC